MRKLFVETVHPILKLAGDDHKHLSLVLRARVGDEVSVANGDGFDYLYTVESITRAETVLKQTGRTENRSESRLELTLFTAVLKGDKNEFIVRMCTELGVARIVPMVTEFTVATKESYKTERMRKIAMEAAKQSGRGRVPEILEPISFSDVLNRMCQFDAVVFPYEKATDVNIRSYLCNQVFSGKKSVQKVAAIVGSEGGFSEAEVSGLTAQGIVPLTLGKRILRADTACVAVCTVILSEAGEMQ